MDAALELFNKTLLEVLLPTLATYLAYIIGRAAVSLIRTLAEKFNIELDARNDAKVMFVVEKWVRYAEEEVEQRFRENMVPLEKKGLLKLELALAGIVNDVPGVSYEQAEVLAKSALTRIGLGAATKSADFLAQELEKRVPAPRAL